MFNKIALIFILFVIFMTSCQKSESETIISETTENLEIYMIDKTTVTQEEFQWDVEDVFYHTTYGEKDNPESVRTFHRAFTTEEAYDTFMHDEVGEKFAIHKKIFTHLGEYAETSGAVTYLEEHGEVPQFFLDYESNYLEQNLPAEDLQRFRERAWFAFLYKNYSCQDAGALGISTIGTPAFIFNNNKISSFNSLLIGGLHLVFDKSFYRRFLYSKSTFSLTCNDLPANANDKASSWYCIGL